MPDFALVNLSTLAIIGTPAPLPQAFIGLSMNSLADLSFTGTDLSGAYVGKGFWPLVEERASLGPGLRHASPTYTVNSGPKTVTASYAAEADPVAAPALAKSQAEAASIVRQQQKLDKALATLASKGLIE